jgi:hypothetical protein
MIRVLKAPIRLATKPHARAMSASGTITVDLGQGAFNTHCKFSSILCFCQLLISLCCPHTSVDAVCDAPSTTVTTTKEELLAFFKEMYMMRRVEITNDNEYKVRFTIPCVYGER